MRVVIGGHRSQIGVGVRATNGHTPLPQGYGDINDTTIHALGIETLQNIQDRLRQNAIIDIQSCRLVGPEYG